MNGSPLFALQGEITGLPSPLNTVKLCGLGRQCRLAANRLVKRGGLCRSEAKRAEHLDQPRFGLDEGDL